MAAQLGLDENRLFDGRVRGIGVPPDARQIISRVGRGFGPPGAVAVALF